MTEQLPVDVWALILINVPPADRLGSCALVSQKLHKAAAAATDALELDFTQRQAQQRAEAFQGYLQLHGSHLTRLKLQCSDDQLLAQLPCSRLLCLELRSGAVQLDPHNGLPGVLANCTGLTLLEISLCQVPTALSGLSVLVDLCDLRLVGVYSHGLATLPGSVFACMQHLTRLHLSDVNVVDMHHVSCLSSLAVLSMCYVGSVRLAPDIAPGFVLPASLHDLSLSGSGVKLDPAVLSAVTQLTRLQLRVVAVVGQAGMWGGAALLAAVSGLHKLDTLELKHLHLVWPQPSAAYQALTVSSRLQTLAVSGCFLPAGAWVRVFPPAAMCGELQLLEITDAVSVEAVPALVRCCPRLRDLLLTVRSGPAVAALKPLTRLTYLHLCSRAAAECVRGVAALANLHDLSLNLFNGGEPEIDRAALLPLTALKALTSCELINECELTNLWGVVGGGCSPSQIGSAVATDGAGLCDLRLRVTGCSMVFWCHEGQ